MKTTMTREAILAEMTALQAELSRRDNAAFLRDDVPNINAAIGHTFVYRDNSCGSGEFDSYRRLLSVAWNADQTYGTLIYEEFEIYPNGKVSIRHTLDYVHVGIVGPVPPRCGWTECDAAEYEKQRAEAFAQLAKPTLLINSIREDRA